MLECLKLSGGRSGKTGKKTTIRGTDPFPDGDAGLISCMHFLHDFLDTKRHMRGHLPRGHHAGWREVYYCIHFT